jgi:CRISPR-associated protein Csx17
MTRHVLPGVRPEPMGSYLAGLGLIRLLGEQADPDATATWTGQGLVIETTIGDLATWLVDDYVPTPVLSPWNGGSGFGAKDREPKRRINELRAHPSPRLDSVRTAIDVAESVARLASGRNWDKGRVVLEFRNRCPETLLPWIDATVALVGASKTEGSSSGLSPVFPPLLGTGGNDGRLDFSTNFHERLLEVLDTTSKCHSRSLGSARDLLAGTETERLSGAAVGQFDPVLAGGQGSSPFGAAPSLVNPWEYVLLVEGALLFASGTVRRHQHDAARAAKPFTVSFSPDGSESGAAEEESRGEVWVPLWDKALTLAEIRQLFGEARASWRGRPAQKAVEFYAATRTLGVTRGIDEFVRYGLQRRNGLAFVAVPLERVKVRNRPEVGLAALIEDWVSWVRGFDVSSAVGSALRRFDAAHLLYARDGGPRQLRELLAALTTLELAVGRSGRAREKAPVRNPPSAHHTQKFLDEFVKTGAREPAELRIAVGIASCATVRGPGVPARTMRQLLLPVNPPDAAHPRATWRDTPIVPGFGLRPLEYVLADVLVWRSRTVADEPGSEKFRGVPTFRVGAGVPARDLHAFARGQLDMAELEVWLRACLALDWRGARPAWSSDSSLAVLVPTLGLLHPLARGLADQADPSAPRLAMRPEWAVCLTAGQVGSVHTDAGGRLRQAGWDAVPVPGAAGGDGTRIAAALVPRCAGSRKVLSRYLAVRIHTDQSEVAQSNPPNWQRSCHDNASHRPQGRPGARGGPPFPAHRFP